MWGSFLTGIVVFATSPLLGDVEAFVYSPGSEFEGGDWAAGVNSAALSPAEGDNYVGAEGFLDVGSASLTPSSGDSAIGGDCYIDSY